MVRKSRNFNGCWTCRSRKVKCDLQKPNCQRCIKAGIECAGYNIKLGWSNPLTVSLDDNSMVALDCEDDEGSPDAAFQRRNIEFVKFSKPLAYQTFKELNKSLEKLDTVLLIGGESDCRVGPFGVYRIDGIFKRQKISAYQPDSEFLDDSDDDDANDYASNRDKTDLIFSKSNNSWVHYELLDSAKLTTLAIKGTNYKLNEQNMLHILYPKFFPNIDSDDWRADQSILGKLFCTVLDSKSLQITLLFKELLNNFKTTTFSFIRVHFNNNYWQTVITPFINTIFCEFICMDFASWIHIKISDNEEVSTSKLKCHIKLGIIYLVLSLSAFQISTRLANSVINENESYHMNDYLKISIELRKMSITLLNYHLDEYDNNMNGDSVDYENLLLLCIILQIQVDNYFSVFENYELLFAIGDFILQNKFNENTTLLSLSRYLVSTFRLIRIFFESTHSINLFNYSIDPDDEEKYQKLEENFQLVGDEVVEETHDQNESAGLIQQTTKILPNQPVPSTFLMAPEPFVPSTKLPDVVDVNSVYVMYGVPPSLIELFNKIIHLTNHKNIFESRRAFPPNFSQICMDIEDKLVHWDIRDYWKLFNESQNPILKESERTFVLKFHQALFHNVKAFHCALVVFFNRLVKDATPEQYRLYIADSMFHLKELVVINKQIPDIEFKPSFWVVLVCGSEVLDPALQRDIMKLWSHNEMGYFNYWRGKQLLYEVWKRQEIGEENSWMDMVREWDIVLCLV